MKLLRFRRRPKPRVQEEKHHLPAKKKYTNAVDYWQGIVNEEARRIRIMEETGRPPAGESRLSIPSSSDPLTDARMGQYRALRRLNEVKQIERNKKMARTLINPIALARLARELWKKRKK